MSGGPGGGGRRIRVWDAPVRLIHWSFVILLPLLWWTWKFGRMGLHEQLGYVTLSLVVFRLFWGFAGSSTARFAGFVRGPRAILTYLRPAASPPAAPIVGHNPLGGWSVVALLALLGAQVALGLFAQDTDGIESGPLSHYVSYETADWAREWHERVFNLILAFVAIHVAAILYYLLAKRDNLVAPMITGDRRLADDVTPPIQAPAWRAVVGLVIAVGLAWWISTGAPL